MLFFVVIFTAKNLAQTTAIPDPNFEQALIDLNIDSDGVVNGLVLTSDIENVVELDFSNLYLSIEGYNGGIITDFSGIEAFSSLEILNLSNLWIDLSSSQTDVFNSNFSLREFIADSLSFDTSPFISLSDLNFSNLPNLEYISLYNKYNAITINLKNPDITRTNLTINLDHEYWDPPNTFPVCINVNDAQAANANAFPYNTWNVITQPLDWNGYAYVPVNFSSTCTLSITDFESTNSISVYPNPVKDKLWFDNPSQFNIDKAEIYNISGQKVKTFYDVDNSLDLSELSQGVYFLNVINHRKSKQIKIIKE